MIHRIQVTYDYDQQKVISCDGDLLPTGNGFAVLRVEGDLWDPQKNRRTVLLTIYEFNLN